MSRAVVRRETHEGRLIKDYGVFEAEEAERVAQRAAEKHPRHVVTVTRVQQDGSLPRPSISRAGR